MQVSKLDEILDASGKSLFPGGLWECLYDPSDNFFHKDEKGRTYWINESGERDYELPYVTVGKHTETGTAEMIYDSRCDPPLLEKA
jgi:hypothetical protein